MPPAKLETMNAEQDKSRMDERIFFISGLVSFNEITAKNNAIEVGSQIAQFLGLFFGPDDIFKFVFKSEKLHIFYSTRK